MDDIFEIIVCLTYMETLDEQTLSVIQKQQRVACYEQFFNFTVQIREPFTVDCDWSWLNFLFYNRVHVKGNREDRMDHPPVKANAEQPTEKDYNGYASWNCGDIFLIELKEKNKNFDFEYYAKMFA